MWISRKEFEKLVKGNDDRDLRALRADFEAVQRAMADTKAQIMAFRTFMQRRMDKLEGLHVEEELQVDDQVDELVDVGFEYARPAPGGT